jgi:hypothetical protein
MYSIGWEAYCAMDDSSARDSRGYLIRQLRQQLGRCEAPFSTGDAAVSSCGTFSSGAAALDRVLPGGGLRHGMLVEWLSEQSASGAATLSLLSAREACRLGGFVVVIDRRQMFYPPAAAAWGIDLDRLIVVQPRSGREELWAAVQSLRSPVVAAVWAAIERIDDRAFRRLQLAAESGRTLGLLLRPADARGQPSWADVRLFAKSMEQGAGSRELLLAPRSVLPACYRRVHVRVLRCHGGRPGSSACLEIDDAAHAIREVNSGMSRLIYPAVPANTVSANHDTHSLPVVAELADPTARPFSAGA